MIKKTVLAGGCFWGMEELIRKPIVLSDMENVRDCVPTAVAHILFVYADASPM